MYLPPHFAAADPAVLTRIVREHPLGTLVRVGDDGQLDADHLPFEFEPAEAAANAAANATVGARTASPHGTLIAHVARANPLWQRCPSGTKVLVIFRGAAGYISPNWYPSKHEAHRQVPTWNYEAVHAHGVLTVRDDERFVRGVVARLTRRHEAEAAIGQQRPWKMSDSAPEYIDTMLANIVGIEVTVTSLVGKAKLGQNKEPRDRLGAAEALAERGHAELAQRMRDAG